MMLGLTGADILKAGEARDAATAGKLVALGVDPSTKGSDDATPVYLAASKGHKGIIGERAL